MDKYIRINTVLSMFSKNYMDLKKDLPIRPSEMAVLNIITQTEGKYTPVALAKILNVSKPMITAHITVLEKEGYILKEVSPQDKRAYFIIPTKKALSLVDEARVILTNQLSQIEKSMGLENFETFIELANTVNEIIEKENML